MKITEDIKYVGVNDRSVDLFEGQYPVKSGISYNSYVIEDEKIAVFDTVSEGFDKIWLENISKTIKREPDYLIVLHMEPDHSANIESFLKVYPNVTVVNSAMAFSMMQKFFGKSFTCKKLIVKENDSLSLGKHKLTFITAPMVHWPEVIMSYDEYDKVLFSADAFGKFGDLNSEDNWRDEARRYYIGIVGKYGPQVQALLKKAAGLDIKTICPLHGPVLSKNLSDYISLYNTWSSYEPEEDGVTIAYTSVYGNTRRAAEKLCSDIQKRGVKAVIFDLARCDITEAVASAFRYSKLVLATTTYNADIFPFMKTFINHLTERNFSKRTVGLIENGSWAPLAAKIMKSMLSECKDITFAEPTVTLHSAQSDESSQKIAELCDSLC